jgi:hypothetical protein
MKEDTTINIKKMTREILRNKRKYRRETYDETIRSVIKENNELSEKLKQMMNKKRRRK